MSSENIYTAAHLFDAGRLTLARELRGWTKTELADRIEKSASAVSQFEGGRARPDPLTLKRMALALSVPVEFFASRKGRTAVISLDVCHFRSLRSASQRSRRKLLAQASLLSEVVSFLEQEAVEFRAEQVTRVARTVTSTEDIEDCAAAVRRDWGLGVGPLPSMIQLLESKGVIVLPIAAGCQEVDAFSLWHAGRPYMFLVVDKDSTSRTRFDAAHELGHLVMHHDVLPGSPDVERQAHRFASAFLMPKESFLLECPRRLSFPHFRELKTRWKVSLAAMFTRARDLGCLSEASYRRAFMELNRTDERMHERGEPAPERPQALGEALRLAEEVVPGEALAEAVGLSRAGLEELLLDASRETVQTGVGG